MGLGRLSSKRKVFCRLKLIPPLFWRFGAHYPGGHEGERLWKRTLNQLWTG